MLKPRVANLGWVLIGQKPYGAAEVEATYGFPVVGLIADDARSVASLEGGVISKRLRRHPFVRSSVTLAKTLSDWLAPISSVGPSIASVPSDQAVGPITPEPARASRNAVGPSMPSAQTGRTEPVGPPPPPTAESQRRAGLPNQSGSTAGPESRPAAGSAPGPEPSQPPVPPPTLPGPPPPPPPAGSQPILAEPPPITAAAPAEPGEPVDGSLRPVQSGEPVDGSSRPPAAFRSRNTSPGSSHGPAPVPAGADRPSAPNGPPRSAAAEAGAAAHEDHVEVSVNPGPAEKSPLAARQAGRGFMHGPTPHRPETERSPLEPRWAYHGNGVDDTGPGPHDELDDELDDQLNDENWYPEFTVTADLGEVFDRPGPVEPAIAEAEVLPCTPPLPPRPPTPPPTSQLVGRAPLANGSDHPSDQRSAPRSPFPHEESDPDWASW